jgi:prepilin-type N-terminal cleavage/methylation domain-containing protein
MKRTRAFTLIELLVVVAIIALLIAILLPALGRVKKLTWRTVCGTNLKNIVSAHAIYAGQFNDRIPVGTRTIAPIWWWDEGGSFYFEQLVTAKPSAFQFVPGPGNKMADFRAAIRRLFYCPSNPDQNRDDMWTLNQVVTGYIYVNDRTTFQLQGLPASMGTGAGWQGPAVGGAYYDTNLQSGTAANRNPKMYFIRKFIDNPQGTARELLTDVCITPPSQNDPPAPTGSANGWHSDPGLGGFLHPSSHMDDGKRPAGQQQRGQRR